MTTRDKRIERDWKILTRFVDVYCRKHHDRANGHVCEACEDLLAYARKRLEECPYDPKPKCKACETHCYRPAYRKQMQEIMRFSGMHFAKRGRVDWLVRYFT